MDIVTSLASNDCQEFKPTVLEWLIEAKLIEKIINLFNYSHSNQIHSNASQLYCDILSIAFDQEHSSQEQIFEIFSHLSEESPGLNRSSEKLDKNNGKVNANPLLNSLQR
jgi:neutral trehalase